MELPATLPVLLLLMALSVVWACPDGCQCRGSTVQCVGLRNLFTAVPVETFHPLKQLSYLSLSGNKVSQLSRETFKGLSQIITLRLNRNMLQELQVGTLDDLVNLGELSLQDNQITHLHRDLFSKTPKLQKLFLSNNKITSLPEGIFLNVPNLSQISLYENQLETLGPRVFGLDTLTASEEVLLQQNPWRCDKDILPLRDCLVVCDEPVLTSTEKRRRPHTPPAKRSTPSPAVKTTPTSEYEKVTRNRQPVALTFTPSGNWGYPINLSPQVACLWTVGGSRSKGTHANTGRTCKLHTERPQPDVGIELRTFLLCSNSANHRATVLPTNFF
uniref:Leucine-rich repeat-containing protein 15-like n=1 Tax=Pundamilia nyererei TaxID=303518 RepID=A0A3B4FEC8_9CICH